MGQREPLLLALSTSSIIFTLSNILFGKLSLNSRNCLSKLNQRKAFLEPISQKLTSTTELGLVLNDRNLARQCSNLWNLMLFWVECQTELMIDTLGGCLTENVCGHSVEVGMKAHLTIPEEP